MRPPLPKEVLARLFGANVSVHEAATLVPCVQCCADGQPGDALCDLCGGTFMITIEQRAAWFARHLG